MNNSNSIRYMKVVIGIIILMSSYKGIGQQLTRQNTISYNPEKGSPNATIEDLNWLAGYWTGEAMGGIIEEVWTPPSGGSMMCAFKLIVDEKVKFYEFVTISEENSSLILKLKHFHPDLKGWEPQEKYLSFPLVRIEPGIAYFSNFTLALRNRDHLDVYVVFKNDDGLEEESLFSYTRKSINAHDRIDLDSLNKEQYITGIGGVFMKAGNPSLLKNWYQQHFGLRMDEHGHAFKFRELDAPGQIGFIQWGIFDQDTDYFAPGNKPMMINLRVRNLDGLLKKLKAAGVHQVGETESYPYGRFAWVIDPEGNKIELWEPVNEID